MIDSAHGSTKWSKIAEAMQEEKASFFFDEGILSHE
jgi:hypothetical protein